MVNNVEEIKSRLNIVDVVGEYVRLTKAGANWKGLCPFHGEKSPSFMVNEEKQIFHCFGCTKGGDVFTFVQEIESLEFREVLKILAEKAGVQLEEYKGQSGQQDNRKRVLAALELATKFYETQLLKGPGKEKIMQYLHERGINDESIENFRLGYAPSGWRNILNFLTERGFSVQEILQTGLLVEKSSESAQNTDRFYDRFRERIMFPIMDAMGAVVGYSARVAPGQDESQAKYINTPETLVYHKGKALYGISLAKQEIKQKNYTLLVEGNLDVIAAHQAGLKNTVAVSGTALTNEQIMILKRYSGNLAMLFDMDSAGQQAARKSADLCFAQNLNVKIVTLADGKDAAEVAQKDPALLLDAVQKSMRAMDYFFNQALAKYDKTTPDGKQLIAKEVLTHVANIESQIEKTHWIKKIAHQLDVEEKVIGDVLRGVSQNVSPQVQARESQKVFAQPNASFQKRSDVLRETLAGLIMSDPKVWQEICENEIKSAWVENDALLQFILKNAAEASFLFDNFLANINDQQAIDRLRKIYFKAKYLFTQESIIEYSTDEIRNIVQNYIIQYTKELQKEKLHVIIREIEEAEQKGDKTTLAKLMSEFTKLSHEI